MSKTITYVNSQNRKSDKIPSNFFVIIPDGLLKVQRDEYFTISVNSFIIIMISTNLIQIRIIFIWYLEKV